MSEQPPDDAVSEARRRLSFGERAGEYDRYRPTYPMAVVEWALGRAPVDVVDVGAGTGLMTRVLLRAGHRVVAVEPDSGMRAQLRAGLGDQVRVVAGTAEAIPRPDASVDAIVAAQAFHWFDLDRALPEFIRVLRPGGVLALVWNIRDDSQPWMEEMSRVVGRLDARSGNRDEDAPSITPPFEDLASEVFHHAQQVTPDELVQLVGTFSYVRLSSHRDEILAEVQRLTRTDPNLAGRDTIELPYETHAYRARRPAA